jgi:2-methylcitrate dehydratase
MKRTLAQRFAEYAEGLRYDDLPPPVIHEVKRRVIDSVGCALGAWRATPCAIARRVASGTSASHGAHLWGTKHIAPPDWAAFANGYVVRYLDYNDTYLSKEPAHPSDNIPAAWSAAEAAGADGRMLIAAIALAYEVQCRLCDAVSIRARGWDHVTYGAFSSALAAGKVMGLDTERLRQAVNIAGVASASLRQSRVGELSHWKGCAFANSARHGVFAAMLAREGMTGPSPIFEGEKGFEKLVSGPLADIAGPFADPPKSDGFMILRTSIKFWPAEYHAQSAIDAALKLREQPGFKLADIEAVVIESHDASVDIIGSEPEKWRPDSRETADHSLPYMTAVALVDGELTEKQFERSRYTDRELLQFVQRVQVKRNAELSAAYPGTVANIVTLRFKGGRTATQRCDAAPGHARNPLTDAQVELKFHAQADPILGRKRAGDLVRWLWQLDQAKHLADFAPLIEIEDLMSSATDRRAPWDREEGERL